MRLKTHHINYIKKALEKFVVGKPRFRITDTQFTAIYELTDEALIDTEFVLELLKEGLHITWCGVVRENRVFIFKISIAKPDEWAYFS